MTAHRVEAAVALAIAILGVVLAVFAPGFFSPGNLLDLLLANIPVLIVATGATLVILTGEIDISVGSVFAICAVAAGTLATWSVPLPVVALAAPLLGAALGAMNGALVAYLRIPSIVVTLATMVALRDGLRWITQGAWVEHLPVNFQWLGIGQASFPFVAATITILVVAAFGWGLRHLAIGRAVYATGSSAEAARLAAIDTAWIRCAVFTAAGALTGLAALLNTARFSQVPSNTGLGLEMKVIAAVVVGGAAIVGGRGTIAGTLLGVVLLGAVGPGLTFLGASAYWERALQGAIILIAVAAAAMGARQRTPRGRASTRPENQHAVA